MTFDAMLYNSLTLYFSLVSICTLSYAVTASDDYKLFDAPPSHHSKSATIQALTGFQSCLAGLNIYYKLGMNSECQRLLFRMDDSSSVCCGADCSSC